MCRDWSKADDLGYFLRYFMWSNGNDLTECLFCVIWRRFIKAVDVTFAEACMDADFFAECYLAIVYFVAVCDLVDWSSTIEEVFFNVLCVKKDLFVFGMYIFVIRSLN